MKPQEKKKLVATYLKACEKAIEANELFNKAIEDQERAYRAKAKAYFLVSNALKELLKDIKP